jgi:transposase InsO family protein
MHRNARLTPVSRRILIERIQQGRPIAHVAPEMGISRATAYKWWARYRHEGWIGLEDRSSRPHRSPMQTPRGLERRVERLRRTKKLGPARIAGIVGMPASTVRRVLVRRGLNRLAWMDRPSGRVIRRIETSRCGELVHVDVKKLGRIPAGGGWRSRGREGLMTHERRRRRTGYAYIHSAIDAYSRVAYSEILDDEQGPTCAGFWIRAQAWFSDHGITVERVLTDNAWAYRSHVFEEALASVTHSRIRPYRPQTNGKVERFNRTLLDEWAYVRPYRSDTARAQALQRWLHLYNHHRAHTALRGQAPMTRVNNLPAHYN